MNRANDIAIRRRRTLIRTLTPYLWIAPALLIMVALLAVPMIESLKTSFSTGNINGPNDFVGFKNYAKLFRQPEFMVSLWNSLRFTICSVALQMLIGLIGALALNSIKLIKNIFRSVALIPMMLTPVIVALTWRLFWDTDFGVFNSLLSSIGLSKIGWLANPGTAFWAVVVTDVWQNAPYVTMMLLAGLQGMPIDCMEAATIDGASAWHKFQRITLPLLKPMILLCLIIRTLFAFRVFEPVYILTNGGPNNATLQLSIYVFRLGFRYFQTGMASALSWVMLMLCMMITLLYIRILGKEDDQ